MKKMKEMKNIQMKFRSMLAFMFFVSLSVAFTSCDKDDDDNNNDNNQSTGNEVISSNITENTTWTSDKVYQLGGRISVESGATLTIEPGTIIKGEAGTGSNSTALLIARGAKLMAEGTPSAPIIFTSVADEITPQDVADGNFGSPNLDPDIDGLWGGVIVLGSAPISASNDGGDVTEVQIEGIPTSDPNGLYGGNDAADNSGKLKYISIRHGGSNIGAGNEINGLTFGGVGNGTVVENIEVVANQDDGIEWFGGTVNVKNVVSWNVYDDALDADQSWGGSVDNFVIITPDGHNFELDGPEGTYEDGYTIKNGIVVANSDSRSSGHLIDYDANTITDLKNISIRNIKQGQVIDIAPEDAPDVTFDEVYLDISSGNLSDYITGGTVPAGVKEGKQDFADITVFNWTWAFQYGELSNL